MKFLLAVLVSFLVSVESTTSFWKTVTGKSGAPPARRGTEAASSVPATVRPHFKRPELIKNSINSLFEPVGAILMYFDKDDADNNMLIINTLLDETIELTERLSSKLDFEYTGFNPGAFCSIIGQFKHAVQSKPRWIKDGDAAEAQRLAGLAVTELSKLEV